MAQSGAPAWESGTGCWRLSGSQNQRLGSLPGEYAPPSPTPRPGQGPHLGRPSAQGGEEGGAASRASRASSGASRSHPARSLLLFPGWGLEDGKRLFAKSFPRSSPEPGGSPWKEPRQPGPPHPRMPTESASSPAWEWAGVPGRWGPRTDSGHCHSTGCSGRGRGAAEGHSPSGGRPPGPARPVREAAQCGDDAGASLNAARGRNRGCRPRPPTASPCGPGTPACAAPSARQEVGAERAAAGGRGEGGAAQEFFQWVELGRCRNPATGGSAGARGASRRCERERGCRLRRSARGGGHRLQVGERAGRSRAASGLQDANTHVVGSPWCHIPDITASREGSGPRPPTSPVARTGKEASGCGPIWGS